MSSTFQAGSEKSTACLAEKQLWFTKSAHLEYSNLIQLAGSQDAYYLAAAAESHQPYHRLSSAERGKMG